MSILTILAYGVIGVFLSGSLIWVAFEIYRYVEGRLISRQRKQQHLIELANHSKDLVKAFGNMRLCLRLAKQQLKKDHAEYGDLDYPDRQKITELIDQALRNPARPLNVYQWREYLK